MKDVKVKFSLLDVIDLMESDIITSVHNDVTEIESSELSQFNNGGEDQFILHLKVPEPKSDLKREKFSREQIKHILAAVAADENGEIVDEIEGVGIVIDSKGNATVEYSAFETLSTGEISYLNFDDLHEEADLKAGEYNRKLRIDNPEKYGSIENYDAGIAKLKEKYYEDMRRTDPEKFASSSEYANWEKSILKEIQSRVDAEAEEMQSRDISWLTPAINEWTEYLLNLRDTTKCDECPACKVFPDSLAK